MTRRITAALLALMLLFTSFPVFAAAEETTVYTKGQTICIDWDLGTDPNEAKSTYPVQTGYMWQIQRDENGQMVSACTLPEHKHLKSCFQGSTKICGIEPHTHDELGACSDSMGWVWEVIRDPNYTGWDYDPEAPENYEFSVCAIDPDGVHPMVGVGFALTRLATEEEKAATGNDKVSVLENSQSLLTNKRGYAYFDGTCSTAEPAGDATWTLVQNTGKFAPGGEYHETYRPHTVKWEVDVTVNGDGTYTVKDIRDPEDDGVAAAADYVIPLPEQGYDKELRRLVMLHDLVRVKLYIDGRFVPQDFESFDVTITGDSGFLENFTMVNGEQGWHYVREDLAPDTYYVKVNMNGYPITYKMGYPNQELTESENGLLLNADHSNGLVEIHFGILSNTIRMNSMYAGEDTSINGNIRYGLYLEGEETPVEEFGPTDLESVVRIGGDDWHVLWDNYGTEGGTLQFTLKQSQVPEYHTISNEEYTVTIRQAAETAEEPYIVQLKKAAGEEEVRYGTDNEQIATFRNQRPDLSYCVTAKTYDDAETPNLIPGGEFALYENDEMIPVDDPTDIDFSVYAGDEKREFILVQEAAPTGYERAEEEYKITVTMEDDKPVVKVAKNEGVLARIAAFFTVDGIEQDEFGRWIVLFSTKKSDRPEKVINTVELHTIDEDRQYITDDTIYYGLFRDTYENGEVPAVVFPNDTIIQSNGVVRITSDDWMNLATTNQGLASSADLATLINGGSIDITLKQYDGGQFHQGSQEEYTLTLSKATDDSGDMFSVVLSAAKGGEKVRYGANGEQIATFVHDRADLSFGVSIRAYDDEETPNQLSGGQYALYENGELVAEYETECDVYKFSEYATEGAAREFTLKQTKAPNGYTLSEDTYKITVTMEDGGPKVVTTKEQTAMEKVAAFLSGDSVEQDKYGRWQAKFTCGKTQYTRIQLTLDDIVVKWNDCFEDSDMESAIADMDYGFVLSWVDAGVEQSEQIVLRAGADNKTVVSQNELPVGTAFKISVADKDALYTTVFTNADGEAVTDSVYLADAVKAGVTEVTVKPVYDIQAGSYTPSLKMTKIDAADIQKTLSGAVFQLAKDGNVLETYTTGRDGVITISDKIHAAGSYTLTETTAPEGYEQLKSPVAITVAYDYTRDENGLRQDLVATAYLADAVTGGDGSYYIRNTQKDDPSKHTAKIELTLDNIVPKWNDAVEDSELIEEISDMDYTFRLSWGGRFDKDSGSEELVLRSGDNIGTFEKELPVGTKFTVTPVGNDLYDVVFTGDAGTQNCEYAGEVTKEGTVKLTAKPRYEFVAGTQDPVLDMYKVNARDVSKPLAGAEFTLKNSKGRVVEEFTTQSDGSVYIEDLEMGEKYTLKETEAPEGYLLMKGSIDITMEYQYDYDGENKDGLKTIRQDLVLSASHSDVIQGSDGTWYIKNLYESDLPQTGDTFDPVLWIGLLTASAAAMAVLLISNKRRHSVR